MASSITMTAHLAAQSRNLLPYVAAAAVTVAAVASQRTSDPRRLAFAAAFGSAAGSLFVRVSAPRADVASSASRDVVAMPQRPAAQRDTEVPHEDGHSLAPVVSLTERRDAAEQEAQWEHDAPRDAAELADMLGISAPYVPAPRVNRDADDAVARLAACPIMSVIDLDPHAVESLTPAADDFEVADLASLVDAHDFSRPFAEQVIAASGRPSPVMALARPGSLLESEAAD